VTAYTERLYPSPGVVAAGLAFAAGIGVVALPLGTAIAAGTFVVAVCALAALLVRSSATVSVAATADGGTFTAGPARLPLGVVGDVEALDGEQMRHARGGASTRAPISACGDGSPPGCGCTCGTRRTRRRTGWCPAGTRPPSRRHCLPPRGRPRSSSTRRARDQAAHSLQISCPPFSLASWLR
jgi:hypothetical protein